MRLKFQYCFLICAFLCCQSPKETIIKDQLINALVQHPEVQYAKNKEEQIIIFLNSYCEEMDCETYFQNYGNQVLLYAKEDLFMRGINKFVRIQEINEKTKTVKLGLVKDWNKVNILKIEL